MVVDHQGYRLHESGSTGLIIIHGANYYPQDIEWAVSELRGAQRGAVVAFSVIQEGEETLIVCVEGKALDVEELKRAVAAKAAESTGLRVGQVAVVQASSLPKTSNGKAQRRKTKPQFEPDELEEHAGEVVTV